MQARIRSRPTWAERTLAPLRGPHRADQAAGVGTLKVNREEALEQAQAAFAVTHPPFCNDWY
jgi:hypothetical protein